MAPVTEPSRNWADDDDEIEVEAKDQGLPAPVTREEPDGTRITTEYKINEEGKKVKVVRKTKMRLIKSQVNHAVAERKNNWKKFGEVAGLGAGPDSNSTSFAEKVFLKLSSTVKDHDAPPPEEEGDSLKKALAAAAKSKINCRICQGDHWTSKCPFKDTHAPLGDLGGMDSKDTGSDDVGADVGAGGKYVPPSLRNRGPGEAMRGTGADRRDDFPTIRITNLSEDAQDQDVKDLVSRFGHTSRVFVSRDRETNICKGFAFVSFYHKDDAEKALETLNGFGYDNLILRVEWAKSSRD
ncbi:eukaryotic translation initiation factor 3 subunit G-domain-containing protein [Powellomyces hirtus]|nr:eukaryotic translation initiation factor 3 subunit G-domain-containing protein [Powellomyces hirtus]